MLPLVSVIIGVSLNYIPGGRRLVFVVCEFLAGGVL